MGFAWTILIVAAFAPQNTNFVESATIAKCSLHYDSKLPSWFPLVWNDAAEIMYPEEIATDKWAINVAQGKSVTVGCTNNFLTNILKSLLVGENTFTCNSNGVLTSTHGDANFAELGCNVQVKETIEVTGLCYNGNSKIDIRFDSFTKQFPLINVCHDEKAANTIMTKHSIQGGALNPLEVSNNRPSFKSAQFYKGFSVSTAYTQASQLNTFENLLGSAELAHKYINPSESLYFARGHLAPDGDFVHIYEQNATYYYVNVMPQWQAINNGNWKALEMAVRNYATENKRVLNVWTGSQGILKYNDINGNPVDIYLGNDKKLPVPELAWKIVEDPVRKASIAVIMHNNPHLETIPATSPCPNICDQLSWAKWDFANIHKGVTYCCDVTTVKEIIPSAPILTSVQILN